MPVPTYDQSLSPSKMFQITSEMDYITETDNFDSFIIPLFWNFALEFTDLNAWKVNNLCCLEPAM